MRVSRLLALAGGVVCAAACGGVQTVKLIAGLQSL